MLKGDNITLIQQVDPTATSTTTPTPTPTATAAIVS